MNFSLKSIIERKQTIKLRFGLKRRIRLILLYSFYSAYVFWLKTRCLNGKTLFGFSNLCRKYNLLTLKPLFYFCKIAFILKVFCSDFIRHLNKVQIGLAGGWLGVGWGFRGMDLSEPPRNPHYTPSLSWTKIKWIETKYKMRCPGV